MNEQPVEKTLKQLFFPIFGQVILFMLVGSVDTLMLSGVGDDKVGAVGAANTYLSLFTLAFSIISNGMLAVMTQYIGAKKEGVARQARRIGVVFNGSVGLLVSLVLFFGARPVLEVLGVAPGLFADAVTYTKIVGGTIILVALTPIYTSYLTAFGHTKESLIANIVTNGLNVILNGVFLYVFRWGVAGVSWATVISRICGLAVLIVMGQRKIKLPDDTEPVSTKVICKSILKVGFPSALETALYNVAMAMVMMFLNRMSDDGIYVTVKSYASQVANFSYCAGAALANANAIMAGWRIGEGNLDECRKATFDVAKLGVFISVCVAVCFAFFGKYIMLIFTHDEEIIRLVSRVLIVDIVLEVGRTLNLVFGSALKIAGDAVYTVTIAVVFMYLFAVAGTYVLGIRLEWYIVGGWIALMLDECARAVLMGLRWRSNRWHDKILIKQNQTAE